MVVAGHGSGAAMSLGDGTHHGQAHDRATRLGVARDVCTIETVEQSVQVAFGQLVHGVRYDKLGGTFTLTATARRLSSITLSSLA